MAEKPILFSTPMVKAILEGRKTQTRRIIKSRHESGLFQISRRVTDNQITSIESLDWDERNCEKDIVCPYGKPGDTLWVRETWARFAGIDKVNPVIYRADGAWEARGVEGPIHVEGNRWKPSIHMPKSVARIWLEITDIAIERVQDISGSDAEAEGVEWRIMGKEFGKLQGQRLYKDYLNPANTEFGPTFAKDSFMYLWQSINGFESWDTNPWVWVVSFKTLSTGGH
jgi:hypothetical protein